ncbi:ankyrin [Aspergillus japonicus CBS 114.51]|uniref:Ankyrin n=1 Tax=Aspergillus japonicus CBS 114.51 TaxID=1448312 RepID=A0A8T8WTG4_ASPJA|nr:ankyrin [Aspergillus japonicus CBS 114.51]RAH78950.1 ankyrin [Aspergillus japonicus CBS 114.51]
MAPGDAFLDAFHDACFEGNLPQTQAALASGRLNPPDLDEALNLASGEAHADIVSALFAAGARITPDSASFLTGKSGHQHPTIVRFLKDPACVRELLSRGADPNRCGPRGVTPLAGALEYVSEDDTSLFELLLEYGAKLEASLFVEAMRPRGEGVFKTRFLLGKGLDPNITSAEWGTPLHRAVYLAKGRVVELLLEAGADPTARVECRQFGDRSPVGVAEARGQRDPALQVPLQNIIELLRSHPR